MRKGDSIGEFLRAVQQQLAPEFREVRTTSVENLLYVKEDLIIPHVRSFLPLWFMSYLIICWILANLLLILLNVQQHSFYELIINKARGKSGPVMFNPDLYSGEVDASRCLLLMSKKRRIPRYRFQFFHINQSKK